MQNKSILVVGGGIAGIASAIFLARAGCSVSLVEKDDTLGGLFRSVCYEPGTYFDKGSHFLRETGNEEIDATILDGITEDDWQVLGNLKGGSYFGGQLNPDTPFVDARLLPSSEYHRGIIDLLEKVETPADFANLDEQLQQSFGAKLTQSLFEPIICDKFFGCPLKKLAPGAHLLLGLSRIVGLTPQATREIKKLSIYDSKLAFHSSNEGTSSLRNFYPRRGGIETWIDQLKRQLRELKVKVMTNTTVDAFEIQDSRVNAAVLSDKSRLECSHVFWTIPLPLFLQIAGAPGNKNHARPARIFTSVFHFAFNNPTIADLHYVQCHEPSLKTFRVTLYSNIQGTKNGKSHLSSEVISSTSQDLDELGNVVLNELRQMGIIDQSCETIFRRAEQIEAGFPLPTVELAANMEAQRKLAQETARNVFFLGKAAGSGFTMDAVLREIFDATHGFRSNPQV